jgi:hypothetical protein
MNCSEFKLCVGWIREAIYHCVACSWMLTYMRTLRRYKLALLSMPRLGVSMVLSETHFGCL